MNLQDFFLAMSGFVAGVIDAIAGGGGLITLPVLTSVLEPGAHAIGTNKIVGTSGALIAFIVYWQNLRLKNQKFPWEKGLTFLIAIGVGSFLGSLSTPYIPKIYFRFLLIAICPLVLFILWNKQIFISQTMEGTHPAARHRSILIATGVAVGFYDGFFGPGGGTLMLLGLLWAVRLPLFEALLLSKLANTISAGTSLVSYGTQGYVHVYTGLMIASGMVAGGFLGAKLATKNAEKIVRPVLAFVVLLLLIMQVNELVKSYF